MNSREELQADVAMMRELGVVEWKGIRLGAAPVQTSPPRVRTPEELQAEREERRQHAHKTLFAASRFTPPLDPLPKPAGTLPTVARGAAAARTERRNGVRKVPKQQ